MIKTCEKIKVDAEYRCFLGIPFGKSAPHYSTFSQNYIRRYATTEMFENIFVEQSIQYGLVKGETFFTDSMHTKANADKNKYHGEIVKEVKKRRKWLEKEIKVSKTNKENGYYHRDNKEKGFLYLDHILPIQGRLCLNLKPIFLFICPKIPSEYSALFLSSLILFRMLIFFLLHSLISIIFY